jgi:aspartyl-tRNA(Asn)/glutamyl-tRNA(Gln) amidotransferase subunit C
MSEPLPGADAAPGPERIDRQRVHHVARLAHLSLAPTEEEQLATELTRILAWVRELDELDTTGVEPTTHAADLKSRLRDDAVQPSLGAERALASAPERLAHGFGVPKIIE